MTKIDAKVALRTNSTRLTDLSMACRRCLLHALQQIRGLAQKGGLSASDSVFWIGLH